MHFLFSPFFPPFQLFFLFWPVFILLQFFCSLLLCGYTLLIAPFTMDPIALYPYQQQFLLTGSREINLSGNRILVEGQQDHFPQIQLVQGSVRRAKTWVSFLFLIFHSDAISFALKTVLFLHDSLLWDELCPQNYMLKS